MTMTSKLVYKKGFGPFAPEVYRSPGPYPYRGVSSDAALEALEDLFRSDVDPESVACAVLEPMQGEGGFIPMPEDFPARLKTLLSSHGILYGDDVAERLADSDEPDVELGKHRLGEVGPRTPRRLRRQARPPESRDRRQRRRRERESGRGCARRCRRAHTRAARDRALVRDP